MRYLIDTNIFVYMASDPEYLNRDIDAIIQEPETLLYISAESVRELIVAYRNKGLCSKRWKSAEAMIVATVVLVLAFSSFFFSSFFSIRLSVLIFYDTKITFYLIISEQKQIK